VLFSRRGPGTTGCNGTFGGTGKDVTVPAGAICILAPGATVTHDVRVAPGGTLIAAEARVGHDLAADNPAGIAVLGAAVGHDLRIDGVSGSAAGSGNYVYATTVGHDLVVRSGLGSAGRFGVGRTGGGNTVGHDLVLEGNANTVTVTGNSVGHHFRFNR
jgi:hypothetical protein